MINENDCEKDKLVNFPLNKESYDRLDDPLRQLRNEFVTNDPKTHEKAQSELMSCEYLANRDEELGQLELFNNIEDQIKALSEHQELICYLIDEIDMYLPRKR